MNNIKLILAAALPLSLALTLSCSDGGGGGGDDSSSSSDEGGPSSSSGGTPSVDGTTKTYALQLLDGGAAFTFQVESDYESCENGILTPYTYEKLVHYGIYDNVLRWVWVDDGYGGLEMGDTLNFSGTSSNIKGTWTRTKNACEVYDSYKICKEGYDITRAVFTDTTLAITRRECLTDDIVNGITDNEGWTRKAVDCNTIQYSKDSRKITQKYTTNGIEWSYNGGVCKQLDKAQRPAACAAAYDRAVVDGDGNYASYYYYKSIDEPYSLCIENTLPDDWWPEGGDWEYCDEYPYDPDCGGDWEYCDEYPYDPDCEGDYGWEYCDLYPEDEDCDDYDYCWMNPWCGGGCYYADECDDDDDLYAYGKIAAKAKTAVSAAKPALNAKAARLALKAKAAKPALKAKAAKPAFKTKAAKLAFKAKAKTSKLNLLLKKKK